MTLPVNSQFNFSQLVRLRNILHNKYFLCTRRLCNTDIPKKKKREDYFFDQKVQSILKKITGIDHKKLFHPKPHPITPHEYAFVTEKELQKMFKDANERALAKLQMPPVMDIREPIGEVLAKDPELQGYLESKLVFIDTSPSRTARNRIITVREPSGVLRTADWDERFRMNQIFFPIEGRSLETPELFKSPYIDKLLDEESYIFLLDSACVQFEPDDPEYHRVTNATYEHIKSRKKFDILRSTRHFGPMAFYFAYTNDINALLVDMVERQLISDAADEIRLLKMLNPELKLSDDKDMDDTAYVQEYIQSYKSAKTADLELAFQTFLEHLNFSKEENALL